MLASWSNNVQKEETNSMNSIDVNLDELFLPANKISLKSVIVQKQTSKNGLTDIFTESWM